MFWGIHNELPFFVHALLGCHVPQHGLSAITGNQIRVAGWLLMAQALKGFTSSIVGQVGPLNARWRSLEMATAAAWQKPGQG
jgi:hypothetical protein